MGLKSRASFSLRLETQNEIAEYRIRLNRKQGEWIEKNIPKEGAKGLIQEHLQATENSRLTLADAGIDRNDSPSFRILAQIPEDRFEAIITDIKQLWPEQATTSTPDDAQISSIAAETDSRKSQRQAKRLFQPREQATK